MTALQPLLLCKLWWRARREPLYGQRIGQRLGWGYPAVTAPPGTLVWLHAVSLGETRAAAVLVQALRQSDPQIRFVFTHGTATGSEAGQSLLREGDMQVWAPWDAPGPVRRFLRHFSPRCGLVLETEVWPTVMHATCQAAVPMALVNARMSARSLARALPWAGLLGPAFASFATVLAQSEADAQRLTQLGAIDGEVVGNLKFDMQPNPALLAQGRRWATALERPVVVLASFRDGEEADWLQAWQRWCQAHPSAPKPHWLIVPRHPNRFDDVHALLRGAGLRVSRRGDWSEHGPDAGALSADVWLGDSMGEMSLYYGMSVVALLGGSFGPYGGQNLIEAVACGCAVIAGPHTYNFEEPVGILHREDALIVVNDLREAVAKVADLWVNRSQLDEIRRRGGAAVHTHAGSAQRALEALKMAMSIA